MKKTLLFAFMLLGLTSCYKETDKMNDIINIGGDIHVYTNKNTILVNKQGKINTDNIRVDSIVCQTENCNYYYMMQNFKESREF